jgi:hypothetical protein
MAESSRRIQIVFTAPFVALLLLSAGCFGGAYWLYKQATRPPVPPTPAPYYVNRSVTAVRPCFQCADLGGKLKDRKAWKVGKPADIPSGEQWWFAPAEEILNVVDVENIPMLAVHPALDKDKPWQGFDQRKILLVVFQDLEPKSNIEHPPPLPSPQSAPAEASASPQPSGSNDSPAPVSTAPQQQ